MSKQSSDNKTDNIVIIATFLLLIVVVVAMIYVKIPAKMWNVFASFAPFFGNFATKCDKTTTMIGVRTANSATCEGSTIKDCTHRVYKL